MRLAPAVTQYHGLRWLTSTTDTDFSQFWRLRARVLAELVPGEGSLPGLQMAAAHSVLTWQSERASEQTPAPLPLLIRALIPSCRPYDFPSTSLPPPTPTSKYHHAGVRASIRNFGEDTHVQSLTREDRVSVFQRSLIRDLTLLF